MKPFFSFSNPWLWIVIGAVYGISLRVLFVWVPWRIDGAMSAAFLLATPLAIGAITIYGLRKRKLSIPNMIFFPWFTVTMMMIGTAVSLLEGSICIALMSPLFLGLASLGGLIMGLVLRYTQKQKTPLAAFALLPFLVAGTENQLVQNAHLLEVKRSIVVSASAEIIWQEIVSAKQIHAHELPFSLSHSIGVPKPLEGINKQVDDKEIRYSVWERGVNFEAEILEKNYPKNIYWRYRFNENSFPKGSMDDHVAIGGKHFNLLDTRFELTPIDRQTTHLTLTAHYRVSSSINFYALPLSRVLGIDFVDTILGLYKYRSETNS